MKITTKILSAFLLVAVSSAHAVPITYQFTTSVPRDFAYATPGAPQGSPPDVFPLPAPFMDPATLAARTMSGTFTIESSVAPTPTNVGSDGIPTASVYWNSVTQMSLDAFGRQVEFVQTVPPGALPPLSVQSRISVSDIPGPTIDPNTSFDAVGINVQFGAEVFGSEFANLRTIIQLTRIERDLSLITNRNLVENLVFTPNWLVNLAFQDVANNRYFGVYTYGASLERLDAEPVSVPEPGTMGLLALGIGLGAFARRRQRHPRR
jgi:hypothetical protein